MSEEETLYEKGARNLNEVYAGDVSAMPEGTMPFLDVMMRTLFGEGWERDVLSIRDRRLLLMGVIASQGQGDIWKIQAKSALKRGELTADELRETLIILAPYAGYPNVASLLGHCESAISEWESEQEEESS